jgi:hypothetical protein
MINGRSPWPSLIGAVACGALALFGTLPCFWLIRGYALWISALFGAQAWREVEAFAPIFGIGVAIVWMWATGGCALALGFKTSERWARAQRSNSK